MTHNLSLSSDQSIKICPNLDHSKSSSPSSFFPANVDLKQEFFQTPNAASYQQIHLNLYRSDQQSSLLSIPSNRCSSENFQFKENALNGHYHRNLIENNFINHSALNNIETEIESKTVQDSSSSLPPSPLSLLADQQSKPSQSSTSSLLPIISSASKSASFDPSALIYQQESRNFESSLETISTASIGHSPSSTTLSSSSCSSSSSITYFRNDRVQSNPSQSNSINNSRNSALTFEEIESTDSSGTTMNSSHHAMSAYLKSNPYAMNGIAGITSPGDLLHPSVGYPGKYLQRT